LGEEVILYLPIATSVKRYKGNPSKRTTNSMVTEADTTIPNPIDSHLGILSALEERFVDGTFIYAPQW
jgi:hypothetical protein